MVKISKIMNTNVPTLKKEARISDAIKLMAGKSPGCVLIVEEKKPLGIITETDIVDATRDFTRFHQIMQEIILTVFGLVTAFFLFFFSPIGKSIFR